MNDIITLQVLEEDIEDARLTLKCSERAFEQAKRNIARDTQYLEYLLEKKSALTPTQYPDMIDMNNVKITPYDKVWKHEDHE